jgi:hypothetical protein
MKTSLLKPTVLYVEISHSSFKALDGEDGMELSLERHQSGRLTPDCVERVTESLRVFLKKGPWRLRTRAVCAVGARGVSMRRITLPGCSDDELEQLLLLQIEREFPLGPEEMAWGYRRLGSNAAPRNGSPATQDVLVVAVKRELIEDYSKILTACGLESVFTVGALARSALCPLSPASYAVLDVSPNHSEFISFEDGVPVAIRALPWGSKEIEQKLSPNGADLDGLAEAIPSKLIGRKLYVTGSNAVSIDAQFARTAAGNADWELLPVATGEGRSPAILGLKKSFEGGDSASAPIELRTTRNGEGSASSTKWKWAAAAVVLAVTALLLRYAEIFIHKPGLVRKIAEVNSYRAKLPNLDRELSFLQYLKTNQPPYFDPLSAIANAAPSGTRVDALSMNRRGDVSIRATMRDSQQVVQFRAKLLDSGVFGDLVVEEQNPTPDGQKVTVRMSGQWKPVGETKPPLRDTRAPATNSGVAVADLTRSSPGKETPQP